MPSDPCKMPSLRVEKLEYLYPRHRKHLGERELGRTNYLAEESNTYVRNKRSEEA